MEKHITYYKCVSVALVEKRCIFWACVFILSYLACKAYAPYYIVIRGLSDPAIFLHIISKKKKKKKKKKNEKIFGKKVTEHKMCLDFI